MSSFNNSSNYENEIAPLVNRIKVLCNVYRIPFVFTAAVAEDAAKTTFETVALTPETLGISIRDDRVRGIINVMNGFLTTAPESCMQTMIEESFREKKPMMFLDDGSIVAGEDGEMVLAELKDRAPKDIVNEGRTFGKVSVLNLDHVVTRKPSASKKTQKRPDAEGVQKVDPIGGFDICGAAFDDEFADIPTIQTENSGKTKKPITINSDSRVLYHAVIDSEK